MYTSKCINVLESNQTQHLLQCYTGNGDTSMYKGDIDCDCCIIPYFAKVVMVCVYLTNTPDFKHKEIFVNINYPQDRKSMADHAPMLSTHHLWVN